MEFIELIGNRGSVSHAGIYKSRFGVIRGGCVRFGYRYVQTRFKQERLHRLVAEAFLPNPENKPEINHIDGDKLNNRVENLEWVTHLENMQHATRTGLRKFLSGENAGKAKLKQVDVDFIRANYKSRSRDFNLRKLGEMFGVTEQCIYLVVKGRNWSKAS